MEVFLKQLKDFKYEMERFVSAWNGEEETFMFEGVIGTEEEVEKAKEIIRKIEDLIDYIK